jgi:hypothetical protein
MSGGTIAKQSKLNPARTITLNNNVFDNSPLEPPVIKRTTRRRTRAS